MSPQETSNIVSLLESSRQDVLDAFEGLSESQATIQPAPDRWSALQCLEHIVIVENMFLKWIDEATRIENPTPDAEHEASISSRVLDRSERRTAPPHAEPQGRYTSLAQGIAAFQERRDRTVRLAEARHDELYSLGTRHPRFGDMNAVEVLQTAANHGRRHAAQVREIRASMANG